MSIGFVVELGEGKVGDVLVSVGLSGSLAVGAAVVLLVQAAHSKLMRKIPITILVEDRLIVFMKFSPCLWNLFLSHYSNKESDCTENANGKSVNYAISGSVL
jgi:hypothetical protein